VLGVSGENRGGGLVDGERPLPSLNLATPAAGEQTPP